MGSNCEICVSDTFWHLLHRVAFRDFFFTQSVFVQLIFQPLVDYCLLAISFALHCYLIKNKYNFFTQFSISLVLLFYFLCSVPQTTITTTQTASAKAKRQCKKIAIYIFFFVFSVLSFLLHISFIFSIQVNNFLTFPWTCLCNTAKVLCYLLAVSFLGLRTRYTMNQRGILKCKINCLIWNFF